MKSRGGRGRTSSKNHVKNYIPFIGVQKVYGDLYTSKRSSQNVLATIKVCSLMSSIAYLKRSNEPDYYK